MSDNTVPTINTLSKLFAALADQDISRAQQFASQIIGDEERNGHHNAAKLLKGSLRPNSNTNGNNHGASFQQPMLSRLFTDALAPQDIATKLQEVALRLSTRAELDMLMSEWRNRTALESAGVRRRSRLLFFGPPGCGKSLTAKALGATLGLPTYIVRFDGVIGAYLGQTAINLRELFRFTEHTPCVLVFDEVDALGKRRGNPLDIGELDRIVIAFMQELEHSKPLGFVIATSNLPDELDPALWRRFDLMVRFPKPSQRELKSYTISKASSYGLRPTQSLLSRASTSKSYAEAEKLVEMEVRKQILQKEDQHNGSTRNKR